MPDIICNAMPVYKEAPVSLELLKKHPERILAALPDARVGKHRIIVPRGSERFIPPIRGTEVIAVETGGGFVYCNRSAVKNVSSGENPIPFGTNGGGNVFTVEELISADKKMAYVGGSVPKAGIYSFDKTITPQTVLRQCGIETFKAMYFGCPMGKVISADRMNERIELNTDYITIYDERDCMLNNLWLIEERYRIETCGRCVFGNEGVKQVCMILSDISEKKGKPGDIDMLVDLCGEMQNQSLCEIGTASANTVLSMIQNFREEIEAHITKKNCKAAKCKKYVTYHVLQNLCIGCNECADACEDGAILGKKNFIHVIDRDDCTQCGMCADICRQGAIVMAGEKKPPGPRKPIPCPPPVCL